MTAALRNSVERGVIAGDATLATLSALLAERIITPSPVPEQIDPFDGAQAAVLTRLIMA